MGKLLFSGVKTFWKTKNSIEVVLLKHQGYEVLEIATYEPVFGVEAPRIYLDLQLIYPLLNTSHVNIRSNNKEAHAAISTFVFNSLFISKFLPTSKIFEIVVRREFESSEQIGVCELMMAKPASLVPYPSPFSR